MRVTAAVIALLLLQCAGARPREPRNVDEERAVVRAAVDFIEGDAARHVINDAARHVIIVAPREQWPIVWRIRDVALPSDLGLRKDGTGLPAGYLLLESVVVGKDTAEFRGRLGPIPEKGIACGTGYTIPMTRSANGEWVITKFTLTVC
jgi:hypothetical protein